MHVNVPANMLDPQVVSEPLRRSKRMEYTPAHTFSTAALKRKPLPLTASHETACFVGTTAGKDLVSETRKRQGRASSAVAAAATSQADSADNSAPKPTKQRVADAEALQLPSATSVGLQSVAPKRPQRSVAPAEKAQLPASVDSLQGAEEKVTARPRKSRAKDLDTTLQASLTSGAAASRKIVRSCSVAAEIEKLKASKRVKQSPDRSLEQALWSKGYRRVGGVDEVGRGPLAGPVVAAVCIIPEDVDIPGINDSKKLTEDQRERLYKELTTHPKIAWAVYALDHNEVDDLNILQATLTAMSKAVGKLSGVYPTAQSDSLEELCNARDHSAYDASGGMSVMQQKQQQKQQKQQQQQQQAKKVLTSRHTALDQKLPSSVGMCSTDADTAQKLQAAGIDFLLVDGDKHPSGLPQYLQACTVVKGDSKSVSIAAASIIAKFTRDQMMKTYGERYPGYGFAQHKGYGVRTHMAAITELEPCPIHRRSFQPIKSKLNWTHPNALIPPGLATSKQNAGLPLNVPPMKESSPTMEQNSEEMAAP